MPVSDAVFGTTVLLLLGVGFIYAFIYRKGYHLLSAGLFVCTSLLFSLTLDGVVSDAILYFPLAISSLYLFYEIVDTLFAKKPWGGE